jgi:hypothetical protein
MIRLTLPVPLQTPPIIADWLFAGKKDSLGQTTPRPTPVFGTLSNSDLTGFRIAGVWLKLRSLRSKLCLPLPQSE